jgi:hypothetical protein
MAKGRKQESTETSRKDSPRLSLAINIINFHSEGMAISPRKKAGHAAGPLTISVIEVNAV